MTGFGCAMGSFFKQAEDDIPLGGAAGKQCYGLKGTFKKNAPKLVLFLPEKLVFWPKQFKKSDFHFVSPPHKAVNYLKISLNMEYFQIKVDLLNV